jgi:hypothetical protein
MHDEDWLARRSQEAERRLERLADWKRESLRSQVLQLGQSRGGSPPALSQRDPRQTRKPDTRKRG